MFDLETRETTIVISGEDYKKLCKLGRESRMKRNGDLAISIDHKDRVLEVLSQLRHECIEYGSIDIQRSNLEEVFLTLTGASLTGG